MIKFSRLLVDGAVERISNPLACSFGILELGAVLTGALTSIGVGAETAGIIGTIGAGSLEGGAIGAITDPKNPLKGAEAGAITGGAVSGLGPVIGSATGFGATASDAIAGLAGGAAGAAATGQNILGGAVQGGVGGAITGAISAPATAASTTPPTGGPAGSAASTAAPASVPLGGAPDVTTGVGADGGGGSPSIGTSLSAGTPSAAIGSAPVSPSSIPGGATAPTGSITAPNVAGDVNLGNLSTATPSLPAGGSSGIGGFLKDNSWLLPAGGLALAAMESQKRLPGEAQLNTAAQDLTAQSKQLENYLQTGTLPPGVQAGIDRASAAAKASIRSQYASTIGSGTSSAEAQDIANVDNAAATQGAQIATNLLQQGISEQGMADSLYTTLMNSALAQDQELGSALGAFSAALVPSVLKQAA